MKALRWAGPAAVLAVGVAALSVWSSSGGPTRVSVPGDYRTLAAALADVPDGSVIELEPGTYRGSVVVSRPVTIVGGDDAHMEGEPGEPVITITDTNDVTVRGLTVSGGVIGILIRDAERVTIENNVVAGNELRGIRVVYGSARIEGNVIRDTWSPYGKGIHVANALHRPATVIAGNVVEGSGAEGIIANLAQVTIRDNTVRGNGGDGIAVTEMSVGRVEANVVTSNRGAGVLVMDMADAEVVGNFIAGSGPDLGAIHLGFHATATVDGNVIDAGGGCPVMMGTGVAIAGSGNQLAAGVGQCPGLPESLFDGTN